MNDHVTLIDTRVQSLVERLEETGRTLSKYAEANELELVFDDAGYLVSTADRARAHREILTEQLAPIEDAFDDHDVPFVVIKDPYLPKPISDVDVLVDDPDGAHAALSGIGFELEDDTEPHRETYVKTVDGTRVAIYTLRCRGGGSPICRLGESSTINKDVPSPVSQFPVRP